MSSFTDFGYGQMAPEDYTDDFSVISFIIRQALAQVSTVKVVQVQTVHAGTGTPPLVGTVDVQPLVGMVDGIGNALEDVAAVGAPA